MRKNIICYLLMLCAVCANANNKSITNEEENIYQKIENIPLKTVGADNETSLAELYSRQPLLIALVFTRCVGVCNPFLLQLNENLQQQKNFGNYRVLVLSFDRRDTKADMQMLSQKFNLQTNKQWIFAITDSIESICYALGFNPVWDSVTRQYDHDALLAGINNEGYIAKKLVGIRSGHDLDLMLASIQNIFSPTYRLPGQSNLFSCFNYNPKTGKNMPGWGLLFIALPAIVTAVILATLNRVVHNKYHHSPHQS